MELFTRNKKTNRDIASGIIALLILQSVGVLQAVGVNLQSMGLFGFTAYQILLVLGGAWIIYGLMKFKI